MKENDFLFYEIMKYPIPKQKEFFSVNKDSTIKKKIINSKDFPREEKNKYINEYVTYINKYKSIFTNLPFIKEIFLCNSITFNNLNNESDIDLFFITKKGSIWKARLFSVIIFSLIGLKRGKNKKRKKFCLTFYITENKQNLYSISLPKTDIYLAYWIKHLIPIYLENSHKSTFLKENERIKSILPNTNKGYLNIGQKIWTKKGKIKVFLELIFGNILIKQISELFIKIFRIPILLYKKNKLGKIAKDIIINDNMLKFYKDERIKIQKIYDLKLRKK